MIQDPWDPDTLLGMPVRSKPFSLQHNTHSLCPISLAPSRGLPRGWRPRPWVGCRAALGAHLPARFHSHSPHGLL